MLAETVQSLLTAWKKCVMMIFAFDCCKTICGEMSEWFKEPVLKTGDSARSRGFESHSLRQSRTTENGEDNRLWRSTQVAEGAPLLRE